MNATQPGLRGIRAVTLLVMVLVGGLGVAAAWAVVRARALEDRVAGLTEQVEQLEQKTDAQDQRTRAMEERLARLAEKVDSPQPEADPEPPPADAYEVFVVAKQWMWKFQHPGGQRESDELHLPAGRPVKFSLVSEDVIHQLIVPGLRINAEARPGEYTTTWTVPGKVGRYSFTCGQYCGVHHGKHVGTVVVLEPAEFEQWLMGMPAPGTPPVDASPAGKGQQVFRQQQCAVCHTGNANAKGPILTSLYGSKVPLEGGGVVVADEEYLRESLLNPQTKIRQGWARAAGGKSMMPHYRIGDAITTEDLNHLIAYLKSLKTGNAPVLNDRLERIGDGKVDQPRLEPIRVKP